MTWPSVDELAAAAAEYRSNWWRTNDDALQVVNDRATYPRLRAELSGASGVGQIVTTAQIYRPDHGGDPDDRPYLPQRVRVHQRIVDACVPPATTAATHSGTAGITATAAASNETASTTEVDAVPDAARHQDDVPTAFFTIGCMGAGKSSVLRSIVDRHRTSRAWDTGPPPASIIDADRVREMLPEYADGLGSEVVVPECYDVTYRDVFDRALARRADIIYDTIGRLSSIRDNIVLLHESGFDIHVLHATCALDVCEQRTVQRALEGDGRLVPAGMLPRAAADSEEALAALRSEGFPLAGWAVVDTTDMSAPTLLEGTKPWTDLL